MAYELHTASHNCTRLFIFPCAGKAGMLLRPLIEERANEDANLGRPAPRDRETILTSLRAQRSNPVSTCGAMDCFAALAMTWREQASLVPHLEKAATRPPKREPPPARRTRLPTKQAGNPSGQNVAFCDAAKASTWPLLTGNGN